MLRYLVSLALVVVWAFAVLRTLMPATRRETEVDLRLRRAQWLTVAVVVPLGSLAARALLATGLGGPPDPAGAAVLVLLVAGVAVAVPVLRASWRRYREARDDAVKRPGLGLPDQADTPRSRHRGLSGQDVPPVRW